MKYPEPFSPVNESHVNGPAFRAMQGDTAITCVDWQAFHSWQDGDPAFTGVITVLDDHGGQQTMANWSSPTDAAADTSLGNTDWERVGPWHSDSNGRRSAPVYRPPDRRRQSSVAVDTGATAQRGTDEPDPNPGPRDDAGFIVDRRHKPAPANEIEEVPMLSWPAFNAE